jgi:alkylation response protein AidB-like acyl-CoA dehydrogenase
MDALPPLAATDAPIFEPRAWRLAPAEAAIVARARDFAARILAPRAARWDREAAFPAENYADMAREGWLAICVPESEGGMGADFRTYCLAAAEFGRPAGRRR